MYSLVKIKNISVVSSNIIDEHPSNILSKLSSSYLKWKNVMFGIAKEISFGSSNDKFLRITKHSEVIIKGSSMEDILEVVNICNPAGEKHIITLPSKNGSHLITKPFDLNNFYFEWNRRYNEHPSIEIHKNNPTNIFIP